MLILSILLNMNRIKSEIANITKDVHHNIEKYLRCQWRYEL